jgi:hypothetical protein
MGHSISEETHIKLERNRRNGVLCAGGVRHCTTPATVIVETDSYTHEYGVGPVQHGEMKFCARHARSYPTGFQGTNFKVAGKRKLEPAPAFEVVGQLSYDPATDTLS